jgi:uncharacterized protein YkwD
VKKANRLGALVVIATVGAVLGCGHNGGSDHALPAAATPTPASTAPTTTQSVAPTVTPTPPPPPSTTPGASTNSHLLYALQLINSARVARGLPPYTLDPLLCACALRHSIDWDGIAMNQIANAAFTAHYDFKKGDTCGADAENQGVGQGPIDPAFKTVFDSMMAEGPAPTGSCNHYGNLMSGEYTRIGIGIFEDNGNVWITEVFAR